MMCSRSRRQTCDNGYMQDKKNNSKQVKTLVAAAVAVDLERHAATTARQISKLTKLPLQLVKTELEQLVIDNVLSKKLVNPSTSARPFIADFASPARPPLSYGITLYSTTSAPFTRATRPTRPTPKYRGVEKR